MALFIILGTLIPITICYLLYFRKKNNIKFDNMNILVIGGSSGLGLSIARILKSLGSNVTIASRNPESFSEEFAISTINVTDLKSFDTTKTYFDFIFCCAGSSKSGYFKDLKPADYQNQMNFNYMGTVNALHHFYKYNKRPMNFIMVASTVTYFTFPGYSAYSPSKAALKSFYDSVFLEMEKDKIQLYIYYVNSMNTPGFTEENKTKPSFTKFVEGGKGLDPEDAAHILLKAMSYKNEITSDFLTTIFKVKSEASTIYEILMLPLAMLIYPIIRSWIKYHY